MKRVHDYRDGLNFSIKAIDLTRKEFIKATRGKDSRWELAAIRKALDSARDLIADEERAYVIGKATERVVEDAGPECVEIEQP